jgi:hypothetical protein
VIATSWSYRKVEDLHGLSRETTEVFLCDANLLETGGRSYLHGFCREKTEVRLCDANLHWRQVGNLTFMASVESRLRSASVMPTSTEGR